ncbi:MAG: 30S ribosomal protein S8 [bacterium]|nr:30S ribosomal protein S8 [bacterium]
MFIDFLIKLKNAQQAKQKMVRTSATKIDKAIAEILKEAGFLNKIELKKKGVKTVIEAYLSPQKPIRGLKFLSRPSLARFASYNEFRSVKSGFGLLVVSTSRGVMTGEAAKKIRVGGQMLFQIW